MFRKRGFTLIETIIALFVLSIAVTAALTSARTGMRSSEYARDEVVAYYLVNETIEYFRNLKDTNLSKGRDWLYGIDERCFTTELCRVDVVTKEIIVVDSEDDLRLKFDSNIQYQKYNIETGEEINLQSGGYGYGEGVYSRFIRKIKLEKIEGTNNEQVILTVTIKWDSGPFKDVEFPVKVLLTNINSI
jgi:prepilin-type N-terminal cleavage/methylation domain-containing protein